MRYLLVAVVLAAGCGGGSVGSGRPAPGRPAAVLSVADPAKGAAAVPAAATTPARKVMMGDLLAHLRVQGIDGSVQPSLVTGAVEGVWIQRVEGYIYVYRFEDPDVQRSYVLTYCAPETTRSHGPFVVKVRFDVDALAVWKALESFRL